MRTSELAETFDFKALKDFKFWRVGLLDPEGKLIAVPMYEHFEELSKHPEFRDAIEQYKENTSRDYDDFVSQMRPDEHPEWHLLDMSRVSREDELRSEIMQKAYDLGWGRIGLIGRDNSIRLELETSDKNLAKLKKYAKELAELLGAELIVTNVSKFQSV